MVMLMKNNIRWSLPMLAGSAIVIAFLLLGATGLFGLLWAFPKTSHSSLSKVTVFRLPPAFNYADSPLSHDFEVVNDTDKLVQFSEVQVSCGCTAAKLDQHSLEPGAKTYLRVTLDLKNKTAGLTSALSRLLSADGHVWDYVVEVEVIQAVEVHPTSIYLGEVAAKDKFEREIEISLRAPSGDALPILEGIKSDNENFVLSKLNQTIDTRNGTQTAVVRYKMQAQLSLSTHDSRASVKALLNNRGKNLQIDIPVTWVPKITYEIAPRNLFFGIIVPEETADIHKSICVTRKDGRPFTLLSCSSSGSEVIPSFHTGDLRSEHTISCRLARHQLNGALRGKLRIAVSCATDCDSAESILEIPFSAWY